MRLQHEPETDPSQQVYQMWCIGGVETGFPLEGGREEVLAGRRETGALQEHVFRGLVPSASTSLWGVSWVWVGWVVPVWSRGALLRPVMSVWDKEKRPGKKATALASALRAACSGITKDNTHRLMETEVTEPRAAGRTFI